MLPAGVLAILVVECVLLVLHFSVTLFVAYLVAKGPKALFRNAFYIIYLLQSFADVGDYFTMQWLIRLPQYNALPVGVVQPAVAYLFFATAYFQFFQCLSHTVIGLNRYTCMLNPTRHTLLWRRRSLTTIIAVLFVAPLFAAGVRLWFRVDVVLDGASYGSRTPTTGPTL